MYFWLCCIVHVWTCRNTVVTSEILERQGNELETPVHCHKSPQACRPLQEHYHIGERRLYVVQYVCSLLQKGLHLQPSLAVIGGARHSGNDFAGRCLALGKSLARAAVLVNA